MGCGQCEKENKDKECKDNMKYGNNQTMDDNFCKTMHAEFYCEEKEFRKALDHFCPSTCKFCKPPPTPEPAYKPKNISEGEVIFIDIAHKDCGGMAYTANASMPGCDGWSHVTMKQCAEKCRNNELPEKCRK